MFGDQGFFERGHNVSFSRSGEENLVDRLDGLISIPQEWHKKKVIEGDVNLAFYNYYSMGTFYSTNLFSPE